MRVGLVCPYDLNRYGGVQQQVLELWRLLQRNQTEVTLVGPGAGVHGGVDVGHVWPVRANGSVVPLAVGVGIRRQIRSVLSTADVVHVHEPLMPAVGLAALGVDRPLVATFHARPPRWAMKITGVIPRGWFEGVVLTAVSPEAAHLASTLGKVKIIPLGIHCADYPTDVPRNKNRIVFLGRAEPRKGLAVLLRAWPRVRARHPRAELIVIGSHGEAGGGIEYAGQVSEEKKRLLLASASVLVAPNLGGESFGLALLEGMAAGCAVVASDIPAFRNLTAGAAVLFPPGNDQELALALAALLDDPAEIERRSWSARMLAASFDWSRVLPAYARCYEQAVAGPKRGVG